MFQLENVLGMIEGFLDPSKSHGLDTREHLGLKSIVPILPTGSSSLSSTVHTQINVSAFRYYRDEGRSFSRVHFAFWDRYQRAILQAPRRRDCGHYELSDLVLQDALGSGSWNHR